MASTKATCADTANGTNASGACASAHSLSSKVLLNWDTVSHPADPLTAAEIALVRDAVVAHMLEQHGVPTPRFAFVTAHEEACEEGVRVAEACVSVPETGIVRMLRLLLPHCTVTSDHEMPEGTQPVLTPADCAAAEAIAARDPHVLATLRAAYAPQIGHLSDDAVRDRLVCDPWSVHMADDPTPACESRTHVPRLVQLFLYFKLYPDVVAEGDDEPDFDRDEWNHYAHPLHFTPVVDLIEGKVLAVSGPEVADDEQLEIPAAASNYFTRTQGRNAFGPRAAVDRGLGVLGVAAVGDESVTVEGCAVRWGEWALRLGFNYREGLVLHDVSFGGRSVARRLAVCEMAVPYADPTAPFHRKCAFDVSDYGLGYCAQSLALGCDCVGRITYLNATLADESGNPYTIPQAVCIHEEDAGTLHKHVEYRSGRSFTTRARRLVLSFVATVVNYEYLFYWFLHADGTVGLDVRLSGMLSTNVLSAHERRRDGTRSNGTGVAHDEVGVNGGHENNTPDHGTLVSPGVNAQVHQHLFCARIDPAVDGPLNTVSELSLRPAAPDCAADAHGIAFGLNEVVVALAADARRDYAPGRTWRIANRTVPLNPVSRTPVAYRLAHTGVYPGLLAADHSVVARRARFARHALWVTHRRAGQRYPAGEFPTQATDSATDGLPSFSCSADPDDPLSDQALTLWLSFGLLHSPRTEDFPIMPCESTGFVLMPDCFFPCNPALGTKYP